MSRGSGRGRGHDPRRVGTAGNPDERSFYACSPHRIEMAARLIRDGYFAEYANPALRLLPGWTEWCIEQSGLSGELAARSRRRGALRGRRTRDDETAERNAERDDGPFRRQEVSR